MNPPNDPRDTQKIPTEDLVAFLDGELAGTSRASIEARISLDPDVRTEAQELKAAWELLDFLPRTEASNAFTARTLDQLALQPVPPSRTRPPQWRTLARTLVVSMVLIVGGLALGMIGGELSRPGPPVEPVDPIREAIDTLPVADLRVIERLPFYRHLPDLAFLQRLHRDGWFEEIEPESMPGEGTRDDLAYLAAQLEAFRQMPAERQDQLRQLDRELFELPPPSRDRLTRTLAAYVTWLTSQDDERRETLRTLTPTDRLDTIHRWRQEEWTSHWPGVRQRQFAQAERNNQQRLIREWRARDIQWHAEWRWARENGGTDLAMRGNRWPLPLYSLEFRRQLAEYVNNQLKPRLTITEANRLNRAEREFREGNVFLYAATVAELAEAHPELPGPRDGPRTFEDLPESVRSALRSAQIEPDAPELIGKTGKWPEFARALTVLARKREVELPRQLGPATAREFDPITQEFIRDVRSSVRTPQERKQLRDAEGRWPEFPETVHDLGRKYGIDSPAEGLPGDREGWNILRRRLQSR